ncbi:MAG: GNAT family N-acetyltransferase [Eubacterium sp.]
MFQLKKITGKEDFKKAKKLYREAFPAGERMPYFMLKHFSNTDKCDFFKMDDNGFAGLMFVVYYKDIVYIFFLAVVPEARGKGYGTKALDEAKKIFSGKRLILNMEEVDEKYENFEQRVKREKFYNSNGFEKSDYKTSEKDIVYEMMHYGKEVSYEEYSMLIQSLFGKRIFNIFYRKIDKK